MIERAKRQAGGDGGVNVLCQRAVSNRMTRLLGILVLFVTVTIAAQPTVSIRVHPPSEQDAQLLSTWAAVITNRTSAPLEDVGYYISISPSSFVAVPEGCVLRYAEQTDCTIDLPASGSREISFTTRNRTATGHFGVVMESSRHGALVYDEAVIGRDFPVTTQADAGPGSLRQAIVDVNASCDSTVPCVVMFQIDETPTDDGLYFVRLHSPLPEITAPDVFIDGGSQIRRDGNSLFRPLIVLDGGAAGEGSGLVFRNSSARATDLAIRGFRGNGIETRAFHSMIHRNFLTGNESRGLVVVGGQGYFTENVLSANGRAGGFFWTPSRLKVLGNIVDGNGASGLFFHKPSASRDFAEARDNVIRGNAHAGIALSVNATGDFAANTFADNAGRAIDVALDGPTTTPVMGYPGRGGIVGAPAITSARYANGVTTITWQPAPHFFSGATSFTRASIYAGDGDAQELVAITSQATVEIPRDLRGLTVRAALVTNAIENFDDAMIATSEVGEGRVVE